MRVAIHAEGHDDYVVLWQIVRHHLADADFVETGFAARGRQSVLRLTEKVLIALARRQSADLLIVCVDSDLDTVHEVGSPCGDEKCLVCHIEQSVARAKKLHSEVPFPDVAVCVAVPAVEAWLLTGKSPECSERWWSQLGEYRTHHTKTTLKKRLHKRDRISSEKRMEVLETETRRVVLLDELEICFPIGLAPLLQKLRSLK